MPTEEEKTADFVRTLPYCKDWFTRSCNRAEKALKSVKGPDLTPIEADMCGKALVGLEDHSSKYEERLLHLVYFDEDNADQHKKALADLTTKYDHWSLQLSHHISTYQHQQTQGGGTSTTNHSAPPPTQFLPQLKPPNPLGGEATSMEFNCWHQAWTDYSNLITINNYDHES